MRVLHVASGNLFGGIETLLITLAAQRAQLNGVEFGFALCFEGRLSNELRHAGARVAMLNAVRFSRPWTVWQARSRLAKILATETWDAVICHGCWLHALAAPAVRKARLPLIFWAHGIEDGRSWLAWMARRYPPDLVLANSKATRESMVANMFPAVATEVLYLPVAPPILNDAPRIRAETRAELGATNDTVVIVLACRLEAWKGHELLLNALARIKSTPNWTCWVIGGPQRPEEEVYLAELRRQVKQYGLDSRVQFLGQRSDVPELFASGDVHCQPNRGPEPFGIAFIEALYAGLPVVTMAIGGALEIVDETCGVLVPEGNVSALSAALEILVIDSRRRQELSRGGPVRATQLCDPNVRLSELSEFLHAVKRGR